MPKDAASELDPDAWFLGHRVTSASRTASLHSPPGSVFVAVICRFFLLFLLAFLFLLFFVCFGCFGCFSFLVFLAWFSFLLILAGFSFLAILATSG